MGRDRRGRRTRRRPGRAPARHSAAAAAAGPARAAATVAVLGAAAGGWAIGHHRSGDGYQLVVRTYDLPARSGYYEVWMYNPKAGRMVAVGTLGTGGRGAFTLPGGMDLGAYHVVDVSAQRYNGNPAHDRSVLRGPLQG